MEKKLGKISILNLSDWFLYIFKFFYKNLKNSNTNWWLTLLPEKYLEFKEKFGSIIEKYDELSDFIYKNGPLDEKTLRLIKLAYALSSGSEGSVHAQVRKSKEQGITKDELFHVLTLGLISLGLPKTVAGYTWINETIDK